MRKKNASHFLKSKWFSLWLPILAGGAGYVISLLVKSPFANPLLVALFLGITINALTGNKLEREKSFQFALSFFIPLGLVFYALKNLNLVQFSQIEPKLMGLIFLVMFAYLGGVCLAGFLLKQRKQITCLTAAGSAICGASAIVMTSPAVKAKPNDISISILAVMIAAFMTLFFIVPFVSLFFEMDNQTYAVFSGSILQFTGYVKVAAERIPLLSAILPVEQVVSLALAIKAVRYLGLLIVIPLFASWVKGKVYFPGILLVYLAGGIIGSYLFIHYPTFYQSSLIPVLQPLYLLLWSVAIAAIGLNTDIRVLLTQNGMKALVMAFAGVFAALLTFLGGLFLSG